MYVSLCPYMLQVYILFMNVINTQYVYLSVSLNTNQVHVHDISFDKTCLTYRPVKIKWFSNKSNPKIPLNSWC